MGATGCQVIGDILHCMLHCMPLREAERES
jgi:hypothetical protein